MQNNSFFQTRRNAAIDGMRFIFICLLCPFHCPAVNPFPNGYVAVEFFFVLAGFFVFQSYRKHSELGTIDFILNKIKRFFWPIIISILLLMLLDRKRYIYLHELSADGIVSQYFNHIPEMFFCQGLHLVNVDSYINVSLWFVSILLIGGAIIFSLLKNCGHKAIAIILPLTTLLGITYLNSFGDCGLVWRPQLAGSPFDCDLVRGFTEMGVGVLLAYVYETKRVCVCRHIFLLNIFGVIGFLGMLLIAFAHKNYDTLTLFLIPMIIMSCLQSNSLFSRVFSGKKWNWLGGVSMHVYFIHMFVSSVYYIIDSRVPFMQDLSIVFSLVGYLVVCFLSGIALKVVSDKLNKLTFS